MHNIQINALQSAHPGLTQAYATGNLLLKLEVDGPAKTVLFTQTLMNSHAGSAMFAIGKGEFNPDLYTKLLYQYAKSTNTDFAALCEEVRTLFKSLGLSRNHVSNVITSIVASANDEIKSGSVVPVFPSYVRAQVVKHIPEVLNHAPLEFLVSDYLCSRLAPLRWIGPDAPFVFKIENQSMFPDFRDLVDAIEAENLRSFLHALNESKIKVSQKAADAKEPVRQSDITNQVAAAIQIAVGIHSGSYDAEEVVVTTLTILGRFWNPSTPDTMVPSVRIQKSQYTSPLIGNLALFTAYQDMLKRGITPQLHYPEELIQASILEVFYTAINALAVFKVRAISDAVAHLGKVSVKDELNRPARIFLYEDWKYSSEVQAFSTTKVSRGHQNARYIRMQPSYSTTLQSTIQPVERLLNIKNLVNRRVDTYNSMNASARMGTNGTTVALALPSVFNKELENDLPTGILIQQIEGGYFDDVTLTVGGVLTITEAEVDHMRYDLNTLLAHLSVSHCSDVRVATRNVENTNLTPYLIFTEKTMYHLPLGPSAIVKGEMVTAEYLELLAYLQDFAPGMPIAPREPDLSQFEDAIHIWDWKNASTDLSFETTYNTTIKNRSYSATIRETHILNKAIRRDNIRFVRPQIAESISRMWFAWILEDLQYVNDVISSTKDPITREAFEARRMANTLELVHQLKSIGNDGTGIRISRAIRNSISEQMYQENFIDDYDSLQVGIQKQSMDIWVGLTILQMFELVTVSDLKDIVDLIKDSNVLTYMVASEVNYNTAE